MYATVQVKALQAAAAARQAEEARAQERAHRQQRQKEQQAAAAAAAAGGATATHSRPETVKGEYQDSCLLRRTLVKTLVCLSAGQLQTA